MVLSKTMSKLLLALALVLVQAQPLTGVLLCEQHRMGTVETPMPGDGHEHGTPSHRETPPQSDCPFMSACTATAPAPVPGTIRIVALLPAAPQRFGRPAEHPAAVFRTPPFHPPSA